MWATIDEQDVITGGAEYEIELWGNNIQPTVPQIDSTTLTRSV